MPRRFRKKYRKKRRFRRKRRGRRRQGGPMGTVRRPLIPPKQMRTLIYSENVAINATAVAPGVYNFSCNGVYDPNITGVGHQPLGFDTYMTLYDHAVIIGAKLTCIFQSTSSISGIGNALVGIAVRDTTGYGADVNTFIEQSYAMTSYLTTAESLSSKTLTYRVNPNKFLGRSHPLSDPNLKNTSSANPSEQVYFLLFVGSPDGTLDPGVVNARVKIEYQTVFIEPKLIAGS